MADKLKKIAVAKKLFFKHLEKVRSGKMTSREFRSEVITGIMTEGPAPMNSAATMYQLVRSEAEANGDLKGIVLGKVKKVVVKKSNSNKSKSANAKKSASKNANKSKSANAKKSASKAAAKKTSKPAAKKSSSKKSVARSSNTAVTSDKDGKWLVTDGVSEFYLSNRDRARTAKAKLGDAFKITPPKATAKVEAPAAAE